MTTDEQPVDTFKAGDPDAQWLKTFVPEVPVEFILAGDPFGSRK